MAKLIGSAQSTNFGENLFIRKAQEFLDDQYIIYWNRQIYGREFDVCILMPGKGILVVELKGWREENILRIENSDTIIIKTNEGETLATPQKQARGYRFAIERHIRQNTGKFPLVFQMVCLPQVSKDFYHRKRLDVVLDESFTILKEDLEDTSSFYKKIDQALSEAFRWKRDPFDSKTMLEVRNLYETDIDLDTPSEGKVAPNEWGNFEQILKTIQEMVEGNRQEIQSLKGELTSRKSRREDTTRIEARLAEEERRSQELLDKLTETEDRLATTEAQNRDLSHTVKTQDALLERKRALEFTEDELEELHRYSTIIVFDTCSIMNYPNLLDGVNDGELVVVPKDVNNELEHHKTRFGADERKIKAQRAISAIFNYKRHFPLTYAEGYSMHILQ